MSRVVESGTERLITHLKQLGVLQSSRIIEALRTVNRADFIPKDLRKYAYDDVALPIGYRQTISQPYTVVFMLEKLSVQPGDKVMDVGYGSGWQSALLANLAGKEGNVYALEVMPELCKWGEKNVLKYPDLYRRIKFFCQSAGLGCPEVAPFDRIIAAATLLKVPREWREQLNVGGKMVYPSDNSIYLEEKMSDGKFIKKEYPGFVFVSFVT